MKSPNVVTDIDHFSAMAIQSKEALGVESLKVVADAGYCNPILRIKKENDSVQPV